MSEPKQSDLAEPEGLWTVKDAARFLHCSTSFVYKRAVRGELPCVRIGAMVRFNPETIRALARGELTERPGVVVALERQG